MIYFFLIVCFFDTNSFWFFFFFQAEDGIRDIGVTGVQTCALPISQRLVRRICPHCVTERHLEAAEIAMLRLAVPPGKRVKVKEGVGCFECRNTGYLGRTGIFEIMPLDDGIKNLITQGADAPEIKREAVKNGMRTLRQSALRKLAEGVTTFEEVVRVTGL